ncbi:CHAP domain-containing protein [Moraxella cuniculi DSM 21768]|uniref:CHAP domain-containing protein n=2 Tax=Moraxella cuniculi TaxID=34061 RepID=A0A1N7D7F0_9GAMM|nr:CHAP domain-containing protein [Moraxella cuniculi]OOS07878.1 CHAP domain-containing protein [Moraxella cuniculi]SIR71738.1 CHAP domain-containing protein [Moraxella cuniculi DSM 21768]VEG12985.1 Uncharacterised protein [Moraxella cuniculi]
MKQVLWLLSAVGLTFVQSSTAQNNYVNNTAQASYAASVPDNIDSVINSLIISSQNAQAQTYRQGATAEFSSNFQAPKTSERLTANSAPSIAAAAASRAALKSSIGRCAMYVRKALQAADYKFTPQVSAYQYASNGTLASAGFVKLDNNNYVPQAGDVAVFNRTAKNPHGHIQIYDGKDWISDFRQSISETRQPNFSPYAQHNGYSVWRDARFVDASANTGTMLAINGQ